MTERDLRDLGVHPVQVPMPFFGAGGSTNAYLVELDGGLLLFDAVVATPAAEAALADALARAGRRLGDVERVVLSHGHVDHYGAARGIVERAGREVPVLVHAEDVDKVAESGWRWKEHQAHYASYLTRLGVPAELAAAAVERIGRTFALGRRVPRVQTIGEGEVIRARHLTLEVLHLPGHTPGCVALHDRRSGLLLAGDQLLEKVSPNPVIELTLDGADGHFKPLAAHLASVERMRALEVSLVLPGHGTPFAGHRDVIDVQLRLHHERQERVRQLLVERPLSCFELTRLLFPKVELDELFLAVSEAIAHLEVLEAAGAVRRQFGETGTRFFLS
jgi:glyoxylase-like metal-dependent hydrolase (beta-lactamase superfamily II)